MTDWKTKTLAHCQLIDTLAARRFSSPGLAEEAALYVMEGLAADDFRRVQTYQGRSRFKTFLSSVIWRLLEDFSRKRFGRHRIPAWITKLGSIWPLLYRLLCVERFSPADAVEILQVRHPHEKKDAIETAAFDLLGKIPNCGKAEGLETEYDKETAVDSAVVPGSRMEEEEKKLFFRTLFSSLLSNGDEEEKIGTEMQKELGRILQHDFGLSAEEKLLLTLCYREDMPVAKAGRMLDLNRFQAHGRLKRVMARIRRQLEVLGLDSEIRALIRG